jgi:hypothetical protein
VLRYRIAKYIWLCCHCFLLVLYSIGDLLIECQQPNTKCNLILHLILAARRVERALQILDKHAHAVKLVEGQTIVVNSKQHLQTSAERVLIWIL